MRAGLAASTVTPGITAPDVSLTTPAMLPLNWVWAQVVAGRTMRQDRARPATIRRLFMERLSFLSKEAENPMKQ